MTRRAALPQLAGEVVLTDGGLETTQIGPLGDAHGSLPPSSLPTPSRSGTGGRPAFSRTVSSYGLGADDPEGRLATARPLGEALCEVETETGGTAVYHMANCAHSTHIAPALAAS